ncbi:uncharacterized protein LOC135394778 [Ornithodoros turicata]|uniref:uncharacterized protein LOC135394778 n=1 Tax=Ornithodoros turicata TaxID=34597 RepID=UPI003138C32D
MARANTVSVINGRVVQQIQVQTAQLASVTAVSNGRQVTHAVTTVVRVTLLRRIVDVERLEDPQSRCATCCTTVLLLVALVLLGVPIYMILIGLIYVNTCYGFQTAPFYLILFGIINLLLSLSPSCCCPVSWPRCKRYCTAVVAFVLALLNIVGALMVFLNNNPMRVDTKDSQSPHYCNPVPYYSAPVFAVISVIMTIFFCYCACCGKQEENT